ncbi:MAG TPA: hypothetical protein VFV83_08110 [Chthoniobacteraceae bacterium]|nr:hypothetical protein [Chthoniobacteraceae bacterium]
MFEQIRHRVFEFVIGLALVATPSAVGQVITSVTFSGSDGPISGGIEAQRENSLGGMVVPFGEDVFTFTDRTHQYNGPRFTAAGTLTFADAPAVSDVTVGLPGYLLGAEYVSTLNGNRDNAAFQLLVGLTQLRPATAYLLIDNRVGDASNTNPPALGAGGLGVMPWVADDGWKIVNTGLSPNGQPDFVGIDEGRTPSNFADRIANGTNQGTGPGVLVNNAYTLFAKTFSAGSTITLKAQNDGTDDNMYGLVVVPEPSVMGLCGCALLAVAGNHRRRRAI